MPPKRKTTRPRAYGRQAKGKTIKSLSLDSKVTSWAEKCAEAAGISLSSWIERQLQKAKDAQPPDRSTPVGGGNDREKNEIGLIAEKPELGWGTKAHCAAAPTSVKTDYFVITRKG